MAGKTNQPPLDISQLSLAELRDLVERTQSRIDELEEESRRQAFEKIQALAADVGLTPSVLLRQYGAGSSPRTAAKAKYRNPDNPQETWSGRGRKPAWIKEWLEAGKQLEELAE